MRIKHMLVIGMALTMLFGCGTNNNESMNDRNLDNVENVRNHPNQRDAYDNGINQYPGGPGGAWEQNQQDPFFDGSQLDQNGRPDQTARNRNNRQMRQQEDGRQEEGQRRSNRQDNYRVADRIAEDVSSEVDEIDRAYVLTMGNNAYVACHLEDDDTSDRNNELSDKVEQKVTEAVKDSDNQIDNVYVSSNPDFVDLTSNYMQDIDDGEPIEGFFDQFTEMIERIFPTRDR
ncbi:YhcN/YlaJ family sporulation lipoprotein [Amphibacillus sp. Q70]|uniref:YhcN/YlaJ family sporulation lipoprotein n=1 Tax=Amphibacillus sp. Q70 TaxID=3453416 RepID=UPI003F853EC7